MAKKPFLCKLGLHKWVALPVGMFCPFDADECSRCKLEMHTSRLNPFIAPLYIKPER